MRRFSIFAAVLPVAVIALGAPFIVVSTQPALSQTDRVMDKVFSDLERQIIREVLGATGSNDSGARTGTADGGRGAKNAPAGLAKRDRLPPGLQRQLARNGRLPPGLEKKAFPPDLTARLPAPLAGTERVIIGSDAVLIETATNIVLDIIYDVVRNSGKK